MKITKPAFTISTLTIFSRITGFIRDILTAQFLGSGFLSDVFFSAFKIANFLRKLLIHEGSFFAAFVPNFKEIELSDKNNGTKNAIIFASKIFSMVFWILLGVTVFMQFVMPLFTKIISPGFQGEKFILTVYLSRIVFPYFILISLSSVLWGVLNSRGKFFYYGFVPCLMNLTVIPFMYFRGYFPTVAHCLCFGVLAGGVVQLFASYLPCYFGGDRIKLYLPKPSLFKSQEIRQTLKKMVPAIIGGGVTQFNTMLDTVLASFIAGGVSYLYYADRLYFFPYSIVGTTLSIVILPILSQAISGKDITEANEVQLNAIKMTLLLILPAGLVFAFASKQLVSIIFQHGNFTETDTVYVARIMQILGIGLIFATLNKVYSSIFFAFKNTSIPMKISMFCVALNAGLSLVLIKPLGIYGITIATTSSYVAQFCLNIYFLRRLKYLFYNQKLIIFGIKIITTACLTGIFAFAAQKFVYYGFGIINGGLLTQLLYLCGLGLSCIALYWILLFLVRINPIKVIFKV
jgi:putative peptidoglycan lipid II flippase